MRTLQIVLFKQAFKLLLSFPLGLDRHIQAVPAYAQWICQSTASRLSQFSLHCPGLRRILYDVGIEGIAIAFANRSVDLFTRLILFGHLIAPT